MSKDFFIDYNLLKIKYYYRCVTSSKKPDAGLVSILAFISGTLEMPIMIATAAQAIPAQKIKVPLPSKAEATLQHTIAAAIKINMRVKAPIVNFP
jgi:hypothetical protein